MTASSVPAPNTDPDLDHLVQDPDYEKLVGAYSGSGLVGTPYDTFHVYADGASGLVVKWRANKYAYVQGRLFRTGPDEFNSTFSANSSGNPRWDILVLQLDRATWKVEPVVKTGTPAASPILPALQRDADVAGDGTGKWEWPVAKVIVASGATDITDAELKPVKAYLAPQGMVATSDPLTMSLITPTPSLRVFQTDTAKSFVGNGSAFSIGFEDVGPVAVPAASGWASAMTVHRYNGTVFTNGLGFLRGGNVVRAGVDTLMGVVPAGLRPRATVGWGGYISHANLCRGRVDTNGAVVIEDFWLDLGTGTSVIPFQASWVAAG